MNDDVFLSTTDPSQSKLTSIAIWEFTLIINRSSGDCTPEELVARLQQGAQRVKVAQVAIVENGPELEQAISNHIREAAEQKRAAIVAGGDGTINLGVRYALQYHVPLAVMAQGTFNLFSRHHGLEMDTEKQAAQLDKCRLRMVPVCWINGLPFTTSVSFGVYPKMIEERENLQKMAGFRSRFTAYVAGLITFFTFNKRVKFDIQTNSGRKTFKGLCLMATQNQSHLENLGFTEVAETIDGQFALVAVKPPTWIDKLRMLVKGCFNQLPHDDDLALSLHESVTINSSEECVEFSLDGEVQSLKPPLHITVKPYALPLFAPKHSSHLAP